MWLYFLPTTTHSSRWAARARRRCTYPYPYPNPNQVGGARAAALHAELDALRSRLKLTDRQTTGLALAAAPRADAPPPPALASPPSPALASPALRIRTASPPARHRRRLTPSYHPSLGRPDNREASMS